MTRMPAWALPLLVGALAVTITVAVERAAGQPSPPQPVRAEAPAPVAMVADQPAASAAAQPQMVRFVTQFITFTPKDASILGDGSDPDKAYPLLGLANSNPKRPYAVKQPNGIWFHKGLADLAPKLGPFDAFRSRDPKAVVKALARIDDRWDYYVLTIWGSGPVGSNLGAFGTAGPLRVKAADGTDVGPEATVQWKVTRIVRVDRLLRDGRAVVESSNARATLSQWGGDSCTLRTVPGEVRVGTCVLEGGQCAGLHPYTTASGRKLPAVVRPGFVYVDAIQLGKWPGKMPWGAASAPTPPHVGRLKTK